MRSQRGGMFFLDAKAIENEPQDCCGLVSRVAAYQMLEWRLIPRDHPVFKKTAEEAERMRMHEQEVASTVKRTVKLAIRKRAARK